MHHLCFYSRRVNYTNFIPNKAHKITDNISCHSKNLIYQIECKKWHCQYIGETKRHLDERLREHRTSIHNNHQQSNPTPVLLHFNQAGHPIYDVHLIPLEVIRSKCDSVRKAHKGNSINKAKMSLLGINRSDKHSNDTCYFTNHCHAFSIQTFICNVPCLFPTFLFCSAHDKGLCCKLKGTF